MKIILRQDYQKLGKIGDVVDVKDGYGRNFLLPRGLATAWTKGGEKQVAQIKRARDTREVRDLDHANEIKAQLAGLAVILPARAGDTGRLFGSITVTDVAEAVSASGGPDLDKRRIEIGQPIKTVGTHRVGVRLHPEVAVDVDVEVVAE